MSQPILENLKNIEKRLDDLTKVVTNKQQAIFDKVFIDNDEFQRLFKISPGTAANWRDKGFIAYSQIGNKIIYQIKDINIMLNNNYRSFKK